MIKLLEKGILGLVFVAVSTECMASNLQKYTHNVQISIADETSRSTLLGIFSRCGNAARLDDSCAVQELERVSNEENNPEAKAILVDYEKALHEGNFDKLECQSNQHMQVNRTIGHCVLLLNYYAIESNDKEAATLQYQTCLQGGLLGLAYEGNIAAQYILAGIFQERELSSQAALWQNSFKARRDSEEYALVLKCF